MKHALPGQKPAFPGDEASDALIGSAAQSRTADPVDLRDRTAACAAGILTGFRVGAAASPAAASR